MKLLGLGDNVMDAYLSAENCIPAEMLLMWLYWPNGPVQKKAVT